MKKLMMMNKRIQRKMFELKFQQLPNNFKKMLNKKINSKLLRINLKLFKISKPNLNNRPNLSNRQSHNNRLNHNNK